ncbi:protein WVD2-like 7 isoform X1 [Musa acuminata AAA Group]|uniref:protein WVD2-like 7 isoform X1 n=1 Tax=Musa acuminata AAA Group TaxID=214697 RepID=UPI0031D5F938
MATDVDQAYRDWSQVELPEGDESHEPSVSQMLEHGSISFGRFPIESLSWERKSVFVHNRCQEELEKFNGLVAKKKAYFEERYRRIRAMKAQQNQQTELTLDYSGDGSISSQSGEEDGAASLDESARDAAANTGQSSEEVKPGPSFEQEINWNRPQQGCLDPESIFQNPTSSRGILQETEPDKTSIDTVLVQPLETESSLPLTGDVEIVSNCSSNLDNEETLQKHKNLVSNFESRSVTQETASSATKTKSRQLQSRKSLANKSLSNVKDSAAVRHGQNVKGETKLNVVRPSKVLKNPSQKMANQTPCKSTASRIESNARTAMNASKAPLTEACSNITSPGPFTLVMERRANSRGSAAKLDPGSLNNQASSLSHAKGGLSVQNMLRKTSATSEITSRRGAEIKRDLKEVKKKPLAVDSRYASSKITESHVGPPKSRSVNLPARNKSTCNGGTEYKIATAKGTNENEGHARMRESQRVTGKTTGPSTSGMGTKKVLSTREADISCSGRKPGLDDLSLDGRKTRRAIPPWR